MLFRNLPEIYERLEVCQGFSTLLVNLRSNGKTVLTPKKK